MEDHYRRNKPAQVRRPKGVGNSQESYYFTFMVLLGVFMIYVAWWIPHYHQEWFGVRAQYDEIN
jgi:hypothetical protein